MPSIDLQTVTLVLLLLSLTSAVSVTVVAWGRHANDGLQWWAVGLVLQSLSYGVFPLRDAGWPVLSIVLTNLMVSASLATHVKAVAAFQELRVLSAVVWGPVVLTVAAAAILAQEHGARIVAGAVIGALQSAMLGWAAYRTPSGFPAERGRILLLAGAALLIAMFAGRAVAVAVADTAITIAGIGALQAGSYFVALVVIFVNTMGYFSMHMERAETRLLHEATHDALTGIANRRAAMQALDREWSRAGRSGAALAVLMIDLDHFKKVNDNYGHQVGDEVLREMARRVRARLRNQDTVARYGGEEFLVVLPDTDADGAMAVAEELRTHAAAPIFAGGRHLEVTVSVGVYSRVVGRGDLRSDIMVAAADRALYRAKEAGRNRSMLETEPDPRA